jgi:riboflavin synthase
MFTGLVRSRGETIERTGPLLRIRFAPDDTEMAGLKRGDSVAVNGVCLTVTTIMSDTGLFEAFLSDETLKRTTLGLLRTGSLLNLERALRPTDRFDGHIVQGHVDEIGLIEDLYRTGPAWTLAVRHTPESDRYIVTKGSVCVDGISLTVSKKMKNIFHVAVIPETWERTNLKTARRGDKVNIETDIIGRYVESLFPGARS